MISLEPDAIRENIKKDCMDYARGGVTRFLPTLASAPVEAWHTAMPVFEEIVSSRPSGAIPMGGRGW
jgi:N-acetylglucosamine-6-phosphate deacetylase